MHLYYRMNDGSLRVSGNLLPLLIIELLLAAIYIYIYMYIWRRREENYRITEREGGREGKKKKERDGGQGRRE